MLRKFLITAIAISFLTIFAGIEVSAQKRVNFRRGSSSGTVTSRIDPHSERSFVLGAKEGQMITARITSKNNRVVINRIADEGATRVSFEAEEGDNYISIFNTSRYRSSFTIVFTIKNQKLPPLTRVRFARGKSSKTINLVMQPYQTSKRYVVNARNDQVIVFSIITEGAAERVFIYPPSRFMEEGDAGDAGYMRVYTDRNGDYIFEVNKIDDKYLSAKMTVYVVNADEF